MVLVVAGAFHASYRADVDLLRQRDNCALVKKLDLTDLCLFTDARYTRHLAMADVHSPFQDHPGSLEHFPSGILLAPPPHLGMKR